MCLFLASLDRSLVANRAIAQLQNCVNDCAKGWFEFVSVEPIRNISLLTYFAKLLEFSTKDFAPNIVSLLNVGVPIVTVPVLSNTTCSTLCAFSSAAPLLINIPLFAPTPVPTITAVGVARPKEQGQAIDKTVRAHWKANSRFISRGDQCSRCLA